MLKCLKNARENGKFWNVLIGMYVPIGIGLLILIHTLYELLKYGKLQILEIVCGAFFLLLGNCLLKWSWFSQCKGDYTVSCDDTNLRITFRKWNWTVKRESFTPADLLFFDDNHNSVSLLRAYQVGNAVLHFYPEYLGIGKIPPQSRHGSIEEFQDVRKMTEEEKESYIRRKHKEDGCFPFFMLIVTFMFGTVPFGVVKDMGATMGIGQWILVLVFFLFCVMSFIGVTYGWRQRRWILKQDCYVATGYSYSKRKYEYSVRKVSHIAYCVRVWDGTSVRMPWDFQIAKEEYEKEGPLTMTLCFYKGRRGDMKIDAYVDKGVSV